MTKETAERLFPQFSQKGYKDAKIVQAPHGESGDNYWIHCYDPIDREWGYWSWDKGYWVWVGELPISTSRN